MSMLPLLLATAVPPAPAKDWDPWTARPIAIATHRGAGTPTGRYGFSLDLAFTRRISVLFGVGTNNEGGGQFALMPRVRFPIDRIVALGLSSGVSNGKYVWRDSVLFSSECFIKVYCQRDDVRKVFPSAWWWNVDASIEAREKEGFDVRFYGGIGVLANPNGYTCEANVPGTTCSGKSGTVIVYGGLSLGWAFSLW